MRLHSLTLKNVRAVDSLTIDELPGTGVVVIHGENEQGKSTILDALHAVLNYTYRSNAEKNTKPLNPTHKSEGPEVTARLTVGETEFTIHKRWARRKGAELTVHSPRPGNYVDDDAERVLEEILENNVDQDLLSALFLRQDQLEEGAAAVGIPALDRALAENQGDEAVDVGEDDPLYHAAFREFRRFYTEKTGQLNTQATKVLQDRDKAVEEAEDLQRQRAQLDRQVEEVVRTEEALAQEIAELPEAQQEASAAHEALAIAIKAVERREQAARNLEQKQAIVDATAASIAQRHQQAEQLEERKAELLSLEKSLAEAAEAKEREEGRRKELAQKCAEARRQFEECKETSRMSRALREAVDDRVRWDELGALLERVDALETALAEAQAAIPDRPLTDEDVRKVDQAAQDAEVAQRVRDAATSHLTLSSVTPVSIMIDGQPQEVHQEPVRVDVVDGVEVVIGEVTARMHGGAGTSADAHRKAEQTQAALAELLSALGLETVGQARQRHAEHQGLQREVDRTRSELASTLNGRESSTLRREHELLGKRWDELEPQLASQAQETSPEEARAQVRTAEAAESESAAALERAEAELKPWEERQAERTYVEARVTFDASEQRVLEDTSALQALLDKESDEAIEARRVEEETARDQAQADLAEAQEAERVADPEQKKAACEATQARVESIKHRIHELEMDQAKLKTAIEIAGDIAERHEKAAARAQNLDRQWRSVERRAQAAKRLYEVLRKHRDAARARYTEPYVQELERLSAAVFGANVRFGLNDKLQIVDRTVDDITVPVGKLSGGAKEQLALLSRFAIASLVAKHAEDHTVGVPVFIDDALGSTDPRRLTVMNQLLNKMGSTAQIFVLTCYPKRFDWLQSKTQIAITEAKNR
ncbi:AAA family ATPase [Corynebacterium tapiri]|uniref:Rad50/SbcC-type AAA domain-containing protein n=1 Tax=Corynebacterium tapiri TaxID=1448266 RepID=A0A5C4U5D8_9CORY|nr:AAA family ATPase [Corynebacterium tapiri]TNL99700.1 hypothetical protein FHE74_01260 [Corynebacterium tapiri]